MAEEPISADPLEDESWDPFELFDVAMGADDCRTPYPGLAKLRRSGPVHRVDAGALMGAKAAETMKAMGMDLPEMVQVVTYEAVSQVLRDGETFSSSGYAASMGVVMGPTILVMDGAEHRRYRGLVQMAFLEKALARWESELVGPIVHRLVDAFADRGRADLVRELTFPFPVQVIAGLLGLPEEDLPRFHRWAVGLISVSFDWQKGLAASQHLGEYLRPIIAARRDEPRDDIISVLARAELDGLRLDDEHILGFLRLLLPAGAETTSRSTANLLFGLLTHPEQLDALRKDRALLPQAMEEGLRWEAPLTGIGRLCTRDTEIGGVPIPAETMVTISLGAANHDETRWDEPESFDIFRPQKQHMAFAFGPHRCLGMHLARMETRVVIDAVLDRLEGVRLDPAAEDVHITGRTFRSPRRLPVVFG